MILKVKRGTTDEEGWVYYDGIRTFVHRRIVASEAKSIPADEVCCFEECTPVGDPTVNVCYLTMKDTPQKIVVCSIGFLMNDDGQTIERL